MQIGIQINFAQYLIIACYFLTNYIYRCCNVGEFTDFDGNCTSQCSGATVGNNCQSTVCAEMLGSDCIQCNDGYYKNNSNQCKTCTSGLNCSTCSSETACLSCQNTYYLKETLCVQSCGEKYFQNSLNGQCQACNDINCKTCINSVGICDSCLVGYYLDDGNCVSSCTNGKYVKSGLCVSSCGEGYYIDQGIECKLCDFQLNCKTCSAGGSLCLECSQQSQYKYLLNGACSNSCGNGFYADSSDSNKCKACTSGLNCSQCLNSSSCSACIINYYLNSSSVCVLDCGIGYFKNQINQTCSQCNPSKNCESCSDNNSCLTCNQSSSYKYLMPDSCATTCGNGYYTIANNQCQSCDVSKNCKSCISNGTLCDSCDQTGVYKYMKNNTCLSSCGDTFYGDANYNCQTCNVNLNCKTCSNPYTCDSCPSNSYIKYGVCVSSCGEGYYANEYNECNRCTKSLNCKTCINEQSCSSCNTASDYPYFYNNSCLQACPDSYYSDNYICKPCSKDLYCKTCTNSGNTCLSCIIDSQTVTQKYLLNGTCVNQCGNRYYTEIGQYTCISCVNGGNCLTCSNQTNCLSCDLTSANKYLKSGLCVSSCGAGMYGDINYNCLSCDSSLNCQLCTNGTSCSKCDSNSIYKYLKNGVCVEQCGNKYYTDGNNICISCSDSNCVTCPNNVCTLCDQNSSFKFLRLNTCQMSCGDQYYSADQNNTCASCNASMNCKTCNDLTACTSCYTNQLNAYLFNGVCTTQCGSYQYSDDNKVCYNCNSSYNCLTCNSLGCLTCNIGQYLEANRCVSGCSDGYYVDNTNTQCLLCDTTLNCKTCSSNGKQCLTCSQLSSYRFLQDGKCVTLCSDTFYPDQKNQCTSCNPDLNCKTCNDSSSCSSCDQGGLYKYLNGNKCVMQCDNGQFPERYECVTCLSSCKTCETSFECTSCDSASLYKYLKDHLCVESCGNGYYLNNARQCIQCQTNLNCKTCSQSVNQCESCYQDSDFSNNNNGNPIYKYLSNGQCQSSCGSNSFPNAQNVCQSCPQYCVSCSQPNKCDVCQDLTWKSDEGICYKCNPGEIVTDDGKKCISQQLCSKNPLYVVNSQNNMCILRQQCLNSNNKSYILKNGSYYSCSICTAPYVISSDRTQCLPSCLLGEILSRDNPSQCQACQSPMIVNIQKNQCIDPSSCAEPNIIFEDINSCIPKSDCLKQDNTFISLGNSIQTCKICQNSVISNNKSTCLDKCPTGQYQINNQKTCQLCQDSSLPICYCKNLVDADGNCVDNCPSNQYINTNRNTKQCVVCTDLITADRKQCVRSCPVGQYLNSPISFQCIVCNGFVSQNGYSCISNCSKITDLDNKKCYQDQLFCPNLISNDGTKCSKYCMNGEVQIQDQKQCATSCPANYIKDIRNFTNICIPSPLCIGYKSSDNTMCVNQCQDILEIYSGNNLTCAMKCNDNKIKIIQNDLAITCVDQKDSQFLKLYSNSLVNFKSLIQKSTVITQEYSKAYQAEIIQSASKLQDIISLEQASNPNSFDISTQIFSDLQSIIFTVNDKSYNNQGILNTFTASNMKISSYKLSNNEIIKNNFNYKDFISSDVSLVSKQTDDSQAIQSINQIQVSYLKQNIFCKEYCSSSFGYFSVYVKQVSSSIKRVLQTSDSKFTLNFDIENGVNIKELTCMSISNNQQVPAVNTIKDIKQNKITCIFFDNVFLIVDTNCKYQDISNCKSDEGQVVDESGIEEDDEGLSSGALVGLVIGILVALIAIGFVGIKVYTKRKNQKKKTKYIDSNNNSKTVDQQHLKDEIKSQE